MNKLSPIDLGQHFQAFIDEQIAQGRYASASEVVGAALRLLEERETKLNALRAALIEGEESGLIEDFDSEAFLAELHASRA